MVFLEDRPYGADGVTRDVLTRVSRNIIVASLCYSDRASALDPLAQRAAELQAEKVLLAAHQGYPYGYHQGD